VFELNTDLEVSSVRSRQTLCERRGVAAVALEIRVAFEFIFGNSSWKIRHLLCKTFFKKNPRGNKEKGTSWATASTSNNVR
jgi:hypothetical protein